MSVKLYMDVHVHAAITEGLRLRGVDVLTAQEDGGRRLPDPALLDRATASGVSSLPKMTTCYAKRQSDSGTVSHLLLSSMVINSRSQLGNASATWN